jgi:signal transduction histidine kinase
LPDIQFTVDSALLRELGERLVGRPHIALAELIKNSYDADATRVSITFTSDCIIVADNGHGMDFEEFKSFWMRVGSPHKVAAARSRKFGRPLTGSKGIGRLSVQFLAKRLELKTVPERDPERQLSASVDWREAVSAGDLTQARARYEEGAPSSEFRDGLRTGTILLLWDLNQDWDAQDFEALAREIWTLQPPFKRSASDTADPHTFNVELIGPNRSIIEKFYEQMEAYLEVWHARLIGELDATPRASEVGDKTPSQNQQASRVLRLSLEFADRTRTKHLFHVPPGRLHELKFEIRIFHLKYRQPHGLKVEDVRNYLNRFGGVHVYDAGFHLPYYGAESDWLRIEIDHSHRLSRSDLLPDELQVSEGMNYLPTNSRIFGVVNVDTAKELRLTREEGGDERKALMIQITRDRLADNESYRELTSLVRTAVDFYAMQEARRAFKEAEAKRDTVPITERVARVEQVLELHRSEIPAQVYRELGEGVRAAGLAVQTEAEAIARQAGLLGALATAGISAIAYEHEAAKQLALLEDLADRLAGAAKGATTAHEDFGRIAEDLRIWIAGARRTRDLFSPLLNEEDRTTVARLKARSVIEQLASQMAILMRGVPIDTTDIESDLRLPAGRLAEWSAIFQNVLLNAANAMLDAKEKLVRVRSLTRGASSAILVEDTGSGVDLKSADQLFEPFVRRQKVSKERRRLGLGGTGLGLTIVRLVANYLGCEVSFVQPSPPFNTAFQLRWKEAS